MKRKFFSRSSFPAAALGAAMAVVAGTPPAKAGNLKQHDAILETVEEAFSAPPLTSEPSKPFRPPLAEQLRDARRAVVDQAQLETNYYVKLAVGKIIEMCIYDICGRIRVLPKTSPPNPHDRILFQLYDKDPRETHHIFLRPIVIERPNYFTTMFLLRQVASPPLAPRS